MNEKRKKATAKEIRVARVFYQTDDVEIDDLEVKVSVCSTDEGRWVSAWVWVSNEMMKTKEKWPE